MAVGAGGVGASGRSALMLLGLVAACAEDDSRREAEALGGIWRSHAASLAALGPPGGGALGGGAGRPGGLASAPLAGPPGGAPPAAPRAALPRPEPLPAVPRAGPPPAAASELLGAAPEALLARLGPPALRRLEGEAQVWLYAGRACQLDLILYPTAAGPRVAHAAARAGGTLSRTEAACLRELAAERPPRRLPAPASFEPAAAPRPLAS